MYQYPANYKEALMYRNATSYGYNSQAEGPKICRYSQLPINTVPIPLCYDTTPRKSKIKEGKPKFMMDAGSTMFFTFIKIVVAYLLLRILVVDLFNIVTNIISYRFLTPDQYKVFKITPLS